MSGQALLVLIKRKNNFALGEPRETNKNDAKPFEIVTNGPNEWIYVGKYRITFNSEQQLYHCGLCSTVNSRRGGLMRHIRRKHIGVKRSELRLYLTECNCSKVNYENF